MRPGDWLFEGVFEASGGGLRLSRQRLNFETQVILNFEHR
jgi:hypothetical protein